MGTRKVTLMVTRTYTKEIEFEVDVDDSIGFDDIQDYLTLNDEIDEIAEVELDKASLIEDETEWRFDDVTLGTGGHL
jgi:hypothetical protein